MHVSRHLWAKKTQKKCSGKTALKIWSQILGKIALLISTWNQFEKSAKKIKKNIYILKLESALFFQSHLLDTIGQFYTNLRPNDQISCSQKYLFSNLSWKKSRNMRELSNATIYPPWSQIFNNKKILQKRTPPSSEMQNLFWRWHLKNIEERIMDLKYQGP